MGFQDQLVKRMAQLNLSQKELAEKADLAQQSISKYVKGQGKPNYKAIVSLAEALDVHPVWFFDDIAIDQMQAVRKQICSRTTPTARSLPLNSECLVIGHWLPMRHLPSPFQGHNLGIAAQLYGLLFSRLLQWNFMEVRDDLAVDWKQISDGWLFQLRPNVFFHDGMLLSTEDVRWSYQQYLHQNPMEQNVVAAEAIDDVSVVLHTQNQCSLSELVMPLILPAGMREMDRLIGSGPFQLLERNDQEWRLEANPHYFHGRPHLSELVIREYGDKGALEEALLSGEVHYARGVNVTDDNLVAESEPTLKRYQLLFMMTESLVLNPKLRQAIRLGLDIEALAEAASLKSPVYSSGPFDTALGDLLDSPPKPDIQQAKQLLEQIPGVRSQALRVVAHSQLPQHTKLASAICQQLGELGLQIEIGQTGHIQLVTRPVGVARIEARHWLSNDRFNLGSYSNLDVDRIVREGIEGSFPLAALAQLRGLIQADIPGIPLFYDETPISYVNQLRVQDGVVPSLTRLFEVHNWYLEKESVKKPEEG